MGDGRVAMWRLAVLAAFLLAFFSPFAVIALTPGGQVEAATPAPQFLGLEDGFQDECAWMAVVGGSMAPALQPGDQICVARYGPALVGRWDIVVFQATGWCATATPGLIVHRVTALGRDEQGWIAFTKGDAQDLPDFCLVREENYRGIVAAVLRNPPKP